MSYLDLLQVLAPETMLVLAALAVLAVDLLVLRGEPVHTRFLVGSGVAALGCVAAACWLGHASSGEISGMFVNDSLTCLVKGALLVLALCAIITALDGNFTKHVGEFLSLILMATIGMMLLVSSTNLLMIFIALELTSLSLYILTAFNKQDVKSAEAALKYFLFGGMSAAFTLYGLSLVYGLTGSTSLPEIADHLASVQKPEPLLLVALVMTIIGFGFKVAAVPFHLWAPDAYQGAPVPGAVLIASGSKVASFFVFARLMMVGFAGAGIVGSGAWHQFAAGWAPIIAVLAGASMVLGNLAAIAQRDVKRLLAYSAVAHAGYALLGLLANNGEGLSSLVYYTITYGLTVAGAFGVVMAVEKVTGGSKLSDFAGLGKREPVISFCMMVFMLSLAGIPPLAGFFGKFYLFTAVAAGADNLGLIWLVFLAVAMSAVSLYYYLQVLKQIYVVPVPDGSPTAQAASSSRVLLSVLAVSVVLLGCWPDLLVTPLLASWHAFGF